ncbi:MAG: hypothetical protein WCB70_23740, partial [Xanthobacteraceae bacterium]
MSVKASERSFSSRSMPRGTTAASLRRQVVPPLNVRLNIPNLLSRGFAAIGVNDVVNATTVGACWMTKRCRQTSPKIRQSSAKMPDASPVLAAKYTGLHALRHFYASWCIN